MQMQSTRPELVRQIRSLYGLESKDAVHFTREEMMKIANYITGVECPWTDSSNYFLNYLRTYGYNEQLTVDTHPTVRNLNWLETIALEIKAIEEEVNTSELTQDLTNQSWLELLKSSLKIAEVDTVLFNNKTLTVTFK